MGDGGGLPRWNGTGAEQGGGEWDCGLGAMAALARRLMLKKKARDCCWWYVTGRCRVFGCRMLGVGPARAHLAPPCLQHTPPAQRTCALPQARNGGLPCPAAGGALACVAPAVAGRQPAGGVWCVLPPPLHAQLPTRLQAAWYYYYYYYCVTETAVPPPPTPTPTPWTRPGRDWRQVPPGLVPRWGRGGGVWPGRGRAGVRACGRVEGV